MHLIIKRYCQSFERVMNRLLNSQVSGPQVTQNVHNTITHIHAQQQQQQQQQHHSQQQPQQRIGSLSQQQDPLIREARLRLDFKKSFMDDQLFFPETSPHQNINPYRNNASVFISPGDARAVLNAGNSLPQLQNEALVQANRTNMSYSSNSPVVNRRSLEQQQAAATAAQQQHYFQNQLAAQQHQGNPYLVNNGIQNYGNQQQNYTNNGLRNW